MNEITLKLGLLMEAAQSHQALAEDSIQKLSAHTQGLDDLVRREIRRTLIEELTAVGTASQRAASALNAVGRAANMRVAIGNICLTTLCSAIPVGIAWWVLPSQAEIAALRIERTQLSASVARLERSGGRIEVRRCGALERLCVRVDRGASAYGVQSDYFIVKGY